MSRYRSKQSRELSRRLMLRLALSWGAYTAAFLVLALVLNATVVPAMANRVAERTAPWQYWYYEDYSLSDCMRYLGLEATQMVYGNTYPEELDALILEAQARGEDAEVLTNAVWSDALDASALNAGAVLEVRSVVPGQGGLEWVPAKEVKQRALEQMMYHATNSSDGWEFEETPQFVAARDLSDYYALRELKLPVALAAYLVGCLAIVLPMVGRSLRSFDELSGAVADLVADRTKPIQLPPSLAIAQDELNAIRLAALSDERAAVAAERRKDELVAYLAHDIKTPLTSVIGYLELLDESPGLPEETRRRYIRVAYEKASRFEGLIDEFFEITRYNLQSIPLEREPVAARLFLEQVAEGLYPAAEARGLSIVVDAPEEGRLYVDPDKMARAIGNVLRNAVAFAEEGSAIAVAAWREQPPAEGAADGEGEGAASAAAVSTAVSAASEGLESAHAGRWVVTVANQGREISEAHLKGIFDKFYRADGARSTRGGGAGLGLAIAKEIVLAHGGAIEAASAEGQTAFAIVVP